MKRDEQGVWRMDYEDMDAKLKENKIHVAVFCNPHNPTGRVWEPEEIQKAMEVYKENDCIVIADEIWSDLILEGYIIHRYSLSVKTQKIVRSHCMRRVRHLILRG